MAFDWIKKWLGKKEPENRNGNPPTESLEQAVKQPDFMNEQTRWGELIVRYSISEEKFESAQGIEFVPSFKKRYYDLLEKSTKKDLEDQITQIHFTAYCHYDGKDRCRENGDKVLKLFEKYIDFDRNWIKEIVNVSYPGSRRWQIDDYDTEWRPTHRYRGLAESLLKPEVLELAEKYEAKPEEIKKIVAREVLDRAAIPFAEREVSIIVRIYNSLLEKNAPVSAYQLLDEELKKITIAGTGKFGFRWTDKRQELLEKLASAVTDNLTQ